MQTSAKLTRKRAMTCAGAFLTMAVMFFAVAPVSQVAAARATLGANPIVAKLISYAPATVRRVVSERFGLLPKANPNSNTINTAAPLTITSFAPVSVTPTPVAAGTNVTLVWRLTTDSDPNVLGPYVFGVTFGSSSTLVTINATGMFGPSFSCMGGPPPPGTAICTAAGLGPAAGTTDFNLTITIPANSVCQTFPITATFTQSGQFVPGSPSAQNVTVNHLTDLSTALTGTITQGSATGIGLVPNPAANSTVIAGPGIIQYSATVSDAGPSIVGIGEALLRVPGVNAAFGTNPNFGLILVNAGTTFAGCTLALLGTTGCPNVGSFGPGPATPVVFQITIGSAIPGGSTIDIQATSAAGAACATDPTPGANTSALVSHSIANIHDLAVTKTATPGPVFAGDIIQYDVTAANLGVFSQQGGNAAASSNAFNFLVTDLLDITPSTALGISRLVLLTPAANFSCTPGAGALPFAGANAPNLIICTFNGAGGLAPGAGTIPVFTALVQTGTSFTLPGQVDNFAAIDASGPGIRRDLNGGSQPPNILPPTAGAVTGNNLFGPATTQVLPALADLGIAKSAVPVVDPDGAGPLAPIALPVSPPGSVAAGGYIRYDVPFGNSGPSDGANVMITDQIAGNTPFVGALATGGVFVPATQPPAVPFTFTTQAVDTVAPLGPNVNLTCTVFQSAGSQSIYCRPQGNTVLAAPGPYADGVLPAGYNGTLTFFVHVNTSVSSGTLVSNPANITSGLCPNGAGPVPPIFPPVACGSTSDSNPGNNTSVATQTLVVALADLGITKVTGNPTPTAGGAAFAYTLVVSNNGPSDAVGIVVTDPLPAGVVLANANISVVNNPSIPGFGLLCTGPTVGTNGTVTCTGNLPGPNGMLISTSTITLVVQAVANLAGGVRTNTATVASATQETSPNVAPNTASVQIAIGNNSSLIITKTGPATACAGDNLNYDIAVTNTGNSSAVNVVVTDVIPSNSTFVSVTGVDAFAGSCNFNPGTNTVTCTSSFLPSGTTHINLVVKTAASTPTGSFTNNATLTAAVGVITGTNPAVGTTTINHCADLALNKTAPGALGAGTTIDYLLRLTNLGPSDITGGINPGVITIVDTLPVTATFISAIAGVGEPGGFTCTFNGITRTVTCVNAAGVPGNFPVGAVTTITIKVKIGSGALPGTNIQNCATITSPTPVTVPQVDPNTSNNTSCASSVVGEVLTVADLGVSKTAAAVVDPDGTGPLTPVPLPVVGPNVPPGSVNAGGYIRYDLPFGNAGPADAVNVRLTDVVPGNTAFVGALATGGVFVPATQPPAVPFVFTIQAVDTVAPLGPSISLQCTVSGSPGSQQIVCTPFGNTGLVPPYANGVLPEGYQGTLTFFVKVNESVTGGTIVSNPANITSAPGGSSLPTPDPNPANNNSLATSTLVVTSSNLSISKIVQSAVTAASNPNQTGPLGPATPPNGSATTATTVLPGTLLTYRLTITNNGPSDVSNIRVTDTLPSGLETPPGRVLGAKFVGVTQVVPSGATFTCGPITNVPFANNPAGNGGTLTCTAPLLSATAPNNTAAIDITVFIDPATTNSLVNVATVDATLNNFNRAISGTTVLTTPVPPRTGLPSDQQAASVLVFPVYTSDAASPHRENTRMSVTNTSTRDRACVHLFNVEGPSCSIADLFLCLTPNQTITFLASELDPGNRGYSMAVTVDCNTGLPLGSNVLIGEEYVKFNSGHAANLTAWGIRAVTSTPSALEPDGETAILKFDGIRYDRLPRILSADNIGSRGDGDSTLLIVDRMGGNMMESALPINNLFGWLYNDMEIGYSFTARYTTCQLREILSSAFPRTTPGIDTVIPATHTGWLKFWSTQDGALIGAQITFNANQNASSRAFNQGHNLHVLTTTTAATLTIPVVIPFC